MRRLVIALVIITLWPFSPGSAQEKPGATIPDTPAGQRLAAFIKHFNSGSESEWRRFIVDNYTNGDDSAGLERRLRVFNMLFQDIGGLEHYRTMQSERLTVRVMARAKASRVESEWVELTLQLDSLPPYKLLSVSFRPGEDPDEKLPEGELTGQQLADYLTQYLDELVQKDRFSGTVLVAKNGTPIFKQAYGLASKRYQVANRIDTKFNLGSMNKMFTGVAIAQLAQQGKLSLDDPIIKHVPDYPNREIAEKVTIHHLLTHTSGMESYWEELFAADWPRIRTVEQLIDLFADKPLLFEPGEKFHYSNSGPIVLGWIIERVTGQSYYDYVRENIYEPAGMTNTDCYEMDRPVENLAIGYTRMDWDGKRGDEWRNNLFMHTVKGGPAGGGYSTVEDLLAFANALLGHQLLSKAFTDTVITGKAHMGPDEKYGYLFGDRVVNGHRIVGHSGGAPGINANLGIYVDLGYTVAVMSNYDNGANPVARRLEKLRAR
jgi:CubicO group peptidase (beta-lactamase class C family)